MPYDVFMETRGYQPEKDEFASKFSHIKRAQDSSRDVNLDADPNRVSISDLEAKIATITDPTEKFHAKQLLDNIKAARLKRLKEERDQKA